MPPIITLPPLVNANQFLSSFIRQPNLLTRHVKVSVDVPLLSIDRRDDGQINKRHAKQFHQVQREWWRLRAGPVKKPERWIKADYHDRVCHILQQQRISKRQQRVAAILW